MTAALDHRLAHTYYGCPPQHPLAPHRTVSASLREHARRRGAHPFLTEVPATGEAITVTYREADALSRKVAAWSRDSAPKAPVALLPANDSISVLAILGMMRAGRPVLLLNPDDPPARLREQISALGARTVLRSPNVGPGALAESSPLPDPQHLPEPESDPDAADDLSADALYFGTSGSTAASKLVAQTHRNAAINAEAVRRHHGLRPGIRLLGCLPIYHVNGLHFTLMAAVVAGSHAILAHGFDPFTYPALVDRYAPHLASAVPSLLETLVEAWRAPRSEQTLRYFVSAAAPLPAQVVARITDRTGVPVLQGYGLTETTNFSTTIPRNLPEDAYRRLMLDTDIPSIGAEFYGNEVAVLREDGTRAEPGEVGEICVRGHNVMDRYVGNPSATEEAFRGGWFHSQDLGYHIVECGRSFFAITGRTKNLAKVAGESVSLEELERALRAVPGVADGACATVPDEVLGDRVVAVVHCAAELADEELRERLRAALPEFALPREIIRTERVPRSRTGKLRRPELGELVRAVQEGRR